MDDEKRQKDGKDKSARNLMRKASRRDPAEDSTAAGSNAAPEMSDAEDPKGKRKKPKKKAAKSRPAMTSRDKDPKEAKTPKDRRDQAEASAPQDDPLELADGSRGSRQDDATEGVP